MKYAMAIFLVVIATCSIFAENDNKSNHKANKSNTMVITGQVTDSQTGEALTGVNIKIPELGINTYTDFDGKFKFKGQNNKNYTLNASFISYKNKSVETQPAELKNINLSLEAINN